MALRVKVANAALEARRIVVDTNGVTIDWHVGAFGGYQLQSATNPAQPVWTPIGTPVQADRPVLQLTDTSPAAAQSFYRLQHVGP